MCPHCKSTDARPSRHSSFFSRLQRWLGRVCLRCSDCKRIYYTDAPPSDIERCLETDIAPDRIIKSLTSRTLLRVLIFTALFLASYLAFSFGSDILSSLAPR